MQVLIQRAQQAQLHVLIGCIDATNQASIGLHEKMGFTTLVLLNKWALNLGNGLTLLFTN